MESIELRLLGGFEVLVDGASVPTAAWPGRARDLVKLLALAPGHRLPRERVVEELWPRLDAEAGFSNLHKAAHHARRAMSDGGAVVLREGQVMLAPSARVETDVELFEASGTPDLYTGELLPDDRYGRGPPGSAARSGVDGGCHRMPGASNPRHVIRKDRIGARSQRTWKNSLSLTTSPLTSR